MDDQLNTIQTQADQTTTEQNTDNLSVNQSTNNQISDEKKDVLTQEVKKYIIDKNIFEAIGLDKLPQEKKDKLMKDMLSTIQNRVMLRVIDAIPEEEQKKLKEIIEKGTTEEFENFVKSKMDINEIIAEETVVYKGQMIDNAQQIDKLVARYQNTQNQ